MKDFMASGSFARERRKNASASLLYRNINQSVDILLKTSLFEPFPEAMGWIPLLIACIVIHRAGKYQIYARIFY